MEIDLFGVSPPTSAPTKNPRAGKYGYPAMPGTGPDGKRCKDCRFCVRNPHGTAKDYPKCEKNKARWTHGSATDIRTRSPACKLFEEAKP